MSNLQINYLKKLEITVKQNTRKLKKLVITVIQAKLHFAGTGDLSACALLNNLVAAIISKKFEFGEVCAVFRIYF